MQLKRVVVTGIGTLTPVGNNLNDYWNGLINGVSGAANITLFDASKFKTRFACEIKGFDPTQFMDRKEARKLDRFAQLALVASDMAVADAGISQHSFKLVTAVLLLPDTPVNDIHGYVSVYYRSDRKLTGAEGSREYS